MKRLFKKASQKAGQPPGTLTWVGDKRQETVEISVIDYNESAFSERDISGDLETGFEKKYADNVKWININGIHDIDIIEAVGNYYGIHPLVLEDILNTEQAPKIERFDDYLFVTLKMMYYTEPSEFVNFEHISFIFGDGYVISFQEQKGDVFDAVRDRLRTAKGRIRKSRADYLLYALIDSIVDNYFVVLDRFGVSIEDMEIEVLDEPTESTAQNIHTLKREIISLRRSIWPIREIIKQLEKDDSGLIQNKTIPYLRDVYDHTIQIVDTIEALRDLVSGLLDIYLSSMSNKMNEIMKILTIISTTFIPLTFIAGVYGMNFQHMPELGWKWSYPLVWLVMIVVAILMLRFFRKKEWL
jgi:magnesium transporter